jgi:hypothetical protein
MSKPNSPSKIRAKSSYKLAEKMVYQSYGEPYDELKNPFKTETSDHVRFERFYRQILNLYQQRERLFDEMSEVYGEFRPDKLKKVD